MTPDTTTDHESDRLRNRLDRHESRIDATQRSLAAGTVPDEHLPGTLYSLAVECDHRARTLALMGDREDAEAAYADAAVYYLASVRESRDRRDMLRPRERHDDPETCVRGIYTAALSGHPELPACVAREVLSMGQQFLAERDTRPHYAAKLLAAVVLEDDRADRFADEYRHATRGGDPREREGTLVYEGIVAGDADAVADGLAAALSGTWPAAHGPADGDGDGPALDDRVAALVRIARDAGIDVSVDVPEVPGILLPETGDSTRVVTAGDVEGAGTAGDDTGAADGEEGSVTIDVESPDDVVVGDADSETGADADGDRNGEVSDGDAGDSGADEEPTDGDTGGEPTNRDTDGEPTSDEALSTDEAWASDVVPGVHRDPESGEWVLVDRVAYPERGPLRASDLPETPHGPLLSDEWVDAFLADLAAADDESRRDLAGDLRNAREAGDLRRRLVVHSGSASADEYLIDGSVFEVGIDAVEVDAGT